MNKKYLTFCFLLSLSFTCCELCAEKSSLNDGEDESICRGYETSDDKACVYDRTQNRCFEKECSQLNTDECNFISYSDENTSTRMKCLKKTDNSGCELKHCEDLSNNCERFISDEWDENCILNADNSHCEIQKCSDLTDNCEKFISSNSHYKCALNEDHTCELQEKECVDYTPDNCDEFFDDKTLDQCVLDTTTNKCKLFRCQDLSSSECDKFGIEREHRICAPKGDKCQIQTCSDFSKEVCETIKYSDSGYKCIYTEYGCSPRSCYYSSEPDCDLFIPLDPLNRCVPSDGGCAIRSLSCEELDKDHCDLYNTEEDKENGVWLCVEKDGKCVIGSKYVEISLLFLLLLIFLF